MKRGIFRYIFPSVTLLAGIGIIITGINMGFKNDYINQLNLTTVEAVIPSSDVKSFKLDVNYTDIEISASNEVDDFEITAENIARDYLKYSTYNNVLNLEYSTNKWYEIISIPGLLENKSKIKITVPADMKLKDIQLENGMGNITVNYLTAENIYIDCGMGNNMINALNAESVKIRGGSGDMYSESITCNEIVFSGGSGDNSLIDIHTQKAKISNKSGEIKISGEIKGNSVISSGTGDITAEIYGDKDDYSLHVSDEDVIINGHKFSGTTKGKYNMNIYSGLGDIKINFN